MAPIATDFTPNQLRDAILAVYSYNVNLRDTSTKFSIQSRLVRDALDDLMCINAIRVKNKQEELKQSPEYNQVFRLATKYVGAKITS